MPPPPQMEIDLMYKYEENAIQCVSQPVSQSELTPLFDGMQRLLDPGLRHTLETRMELVAGTSCRAIAGQVFPQVLKWLLSPLNDGLFGSQIIPKTQDAYILYLPASLWAFRVVLSRDPSQIIRINSRF